MRLWKITHFCALLRASVLCLSVSVRFFLSKWPAEKAQAQSCPKNAKKCFYATTPFSYTPFSVSLTLLGKDPSVGFFKKQTTSLKARIPETFTQVKTRFAIEMAITEWEPGREQTSRENGKENGRWPEARNGRKMAAKMENNGQKLAKIPFWGPFCHFDSHFSAISGLGPFSNFFLSHFLGPFAPVRFPIL